MIAIIDYGIGNVGSVAKAFARLGVPAQLTREAEVIAAADGVVLPGVGAFGDGMANIRAFGLAEVIRQVVRQGTPFLGICLGLQFLFDASEEAPGVPGLGILPGRVCRLAPPPGGKTPHMGWNSLAYPRPSRLLAGLPAGAYVYFVHGYAAVPARQEDVIAVTDYGGPVTAAVERDNVMAVQFHPEKSSAVGMAILQNFKELVS